VTSVLRVVVLCPVGVTVGMVMPTAVLHRFQPREAYVSQGQGSEPANHNQGEENLFHAPTTFL